MNLSVSPELSSELRYEDEYIRKVLDRVKTIAMVGASPNWVRPSNFVMKYLQGKGYKVIPVNPFSVGKKINGEVVVEKLEDIKIPIDIVNIFRPSKEASAIAQQAIKIGTKVLWLQFGIENEEARKIVESNLLVLTFIIRSF